MKEKSKTERFEMRVSPIFKQLIKKLAEKNQMSPPQYLESLVRREAENSDIKIED
ncbi:hypothetical protein HHL23_09300 [Chryseobacterium sp. RP-3-3]|uniref:Uncharacterized protein n=1 Tax=Chryseobacterium antibioticum TaxID=2728847 RepID=A0A7Y0AML9_9FLAO|nr:hypothetical protein [Chryseobacterium antibioticum]NML69995.1 hypothetical protein [Chryseobacterium antibioticum]